MGVNAAFSTTLFCLESDFKEVNLSNIDPTVILKLHSILSGVDVFNLTNDYDYCISNRDQKVIQMAIPNDLKRLIAGIKEQDKSEIVSAWTRSQEVTLCNWTETQTEVYLFTLIEACRKNTGLIKLNMFVDSKPPFCS